MVVNPEPPAYVFAPAIAVVGNDNENLDIFKNHPYIFNLGHGILPETDPEMVDILVKLVKEYK